MTVSDPLSEFIKWAEESPEFPFITYLNLDNELTAITLGQTLIHVAYIRDIIDTRVPPQTKRIGLFYGSETGCVAALLGCWAAGKSAVFINSSWTKDLFDTITNRLGITTILYEKAPIPADASSINFIHLSPSSGPSTYAPFDISKLPEEALVIHSSGTMGIPKSVPWLMNRIPNAWPEQIIHGERANVPASPTFTTVARLLAISSFMKGGLHFAPEDPWKTFGKEHGDSSIVLLNIISGMKYAGFMVVPAAGLVGALQFVPESTRFLNIKQIVFIGESVVGEHVRRVHMACPNASIFDGFGATECCSCNIWSFLSKEDLENDLIPDDIVLSYPNGIDEILILDLENPTKPLAKEDGVEGILAVIPKGGYPQEPPTFVGADEKDLTYSFTTYNGRRLIKYGDIVRWHNKPGKFGFTVVGRVGREVKANGIYVRLDFFDEFIASTKLLPSRTHTIQTQGVLVVLIEGGFAQDDNNWTNLINEKLSQHAFKLQIAAILPIKQFPVTDYGKLDLRKLQREADAMVQTLGIKSDSTIPDTEHVAREVLMAGWHIKY